MNAIRKFQIVKDNQVVVQLPKDLEGKRVEVIVLETDNQYPTFNEFKVDWEDLYGSLKTDESIEEIDERIRALRSEWDRGF